MDRFARAVSSLLLSRRPSPSAAAGGASLGYALTRHQQQQTRGITVRVVNGNVEQALQQLGRRMRDSGMESLIRKKAYFDRFLCDHHVKDSTRRYIHRRKIQYRIRNQELFRTLRTLLAKKMSGH